MFAKRNWPVTNWATQQLRSGCGASGLRSESIGGLRTGSRETLEVTNWCYARVAHNGNYIIQRIIKNSSDRIF